MQGQCMCGDVCLCGCEQAIEVYTQCWVLHSWFKPALAEKARVLMKEDDWECQECNTMNKMDINDIYSCYCKKCKRKNEWIEHMIKLASN